MARHVELPAEECDRKTLLEKKPVAQIPVLWCQVTLPRVAHQSERLVTPSIHDLEKHRAAGRGRAFGEEEQQVAGEFHFSISVPRGGRKISDSLIRGQLRVDRVVHASDHAFMRPKVFAAAHVDPDDFGRRDLRGHEQDEEDSQQKSRQGAGTWHACVEQHYIQPASTDHDTLRHRDTEKSEGFSVRLPT
jgi:hypothetical protein